MPITALLDFHVKTESLAAAAVVLRETLADTRNFDGCLGVNVLMDTDDPTHFVLLEVWASLEHDAAYRQWRAGAGLSGLGDILAGTPVLTRFETAADI